MSASVNEPYHLDGCDSQCCKQCRFPAYSGLKVRVHGIPELSYEFGRILDFVNKNFKVKLDSGKICFAIKKPSTTSDYRVPEIAEFISYQESRSVDNLVIAD